MTRARAPTRIVIAVGEEPVDVFTGRTSAATAHLAARTRAASVAPDAGTLAPSWLHDGSVVREQSSAPVYIIFGGARFHIGSSRELAALGISWSQVTVVPDHATDPLARVPGGGRWSATGRPRRCGSAWAIGCGANWQTIFKVGDILAMGIDPLTDDADQHARAATPPFHLECNGWEYAKHPGVARPADWDVTDAKAASCPESCGPYLPTASGGRPGGQPLTVGRYVRVVGSLVHDIPHCHGHGGGFAEFWEHNFGIGGGSGP